MQKTLLVIRTEPHGKPLEIVMEHYDEALELLAKIYEGALDSDINTCFSINISPLVEG